MAYRTPQQFKKSFPVALGDMGLNIPFDEQTIGDSPDRPLPAEPPLLIEEEELNMGSITPPPPPPPPPRGTTLSKALKFSNMGAAAGERSNTFLTHPLTHLGIGTFAGILIADAIPEAMMVGMKMKPFTMGATVVTTLGILATIRK